MTNYYGNRWMLIRCSRVLEPLDKCSDAKNSQPASVGLLTGAGAYLQKSAQSSRDQAFGVAVEFSMPKTPGFFFFLLFHPTWQLASCDLTLIDAGLEKNVVEQGFRLQRVISQAADVALLLMK